MDHAFPRDFESGAHEAGLAVTQALQNLVSGDVESARSWLEADSIGSGFALTMVEPAPGAVGCQPVILVTSAAERFFLTEVLASIQGTIKHVPATRSSLIDAIGDLLHSRATMDIAPMPRAQNDEDVIWRKIRSLTPQQKIVLGYLAKGRLNKQIAWDLQVSITTVKAHVSSVMAKLGVMNRVQAVILASKVGFDGLADDPRCAQDAPSASPVGGSRLAH